MKTVATMQLFIKEIGSGRSIVYHASPDDTLIALKERILCTREPGAFSKPGDSGSMLVADASWYLSDSRGRNLEYDGGTLQELGVTDQQTLHIRPRMLGGKGGFGTELRMQSKKTRAEACHQFRRLSRSKWQTP